MSKGGGFSPHAHGEDRVPGLGQLQRLVGRPDALPDPPRRAQRDGEASADSGAQAGEALARRRDVGLGGSMAGDFGVASLG
jgi:hypothetical protein